MSLSKEQVRTIEKEFIVNINCEFKEFGLMSYVNRIKTMLKRNNLTREWFEWFYKENKDKSIVIEGFLDIIARMNPESLGKVGYRILEQIINQHDSENGVIDKAIMVIENWRTIECLEIIDNFETDEKWLIGYAREIKEQLREELYPD